MTYSSMVPSQKLHFLERTNCLNLNFNLHPLDPQFSNLHTCPNRSVARNDPLEVRRDNIESLGNVDMVAADCIDILPRQPTVD